MSTKEPKFWDCDAGAEILNAEDIDEAINNYLDDLTNKDLKLALTETLTVFGFAVREPTIAGLETCCIDPLLELLDENYGNPDEDPTPVNANMLEAEEIFLKAVLEQYESWVCEVVTKVEVNVQEWVDKNAPDLLEYVE